MRDGIWKAESWRSFDISPHMVRTDEVKLARASQVGTNDLQSCTTLSDFIKALSGA